MLKLIILPRQARDKHSLGKALKKEMRCLQAASRGRRRQRPRTGLLPSFRAGLGGKASTDNARGNIHVPYTLPVKKQTVVAAGGRRRWVVSLWAVMVALGLLIGGAAARCATRFWRHLLSFGTPIFSSAKTRSGQTQRNLFSRGGLYRRRSLHAGAWPRVTLVLRWLARGGGKLRNIAGRRARALRSRGAPAVVAP
jgi:hypothetical protein